MVAANMSGELSGRVAIVTGGASGIGAAAAALLEQQGARVVVADLQEAKDGPGRFVHHEPATNPSEDPDGDWVTFASRYQRLFGRPTELWVAALLFPA